jgi:hypothetical protein
MKEKKQRIEKKQRPVKENKKDGEKENNSG